MKNFIVVIVILMPNLIFWANAANPGNNFSDINGIKFNTVQCVWFAIHFVFHFFLLPTVFKG
jgi:hypothetical protein